MIVANKLAGCKMTSPKTFSVLPARRVHTLPQSMSIDDCCAGCQRW